MELKPAQCARLELPGAPETKAMLTRQQHTLQHKRIANATVLLLRRFAKHVLGHLLEELITPLLFNSLHIIIH